MLPLVSILVGIGIFVSFSILLWYMLTWPKQWTRFTEEENAFWVKRGFPVKWAGACQKFEQGRGLKVLVGFCILVALALIITPFVEHFILSRHG